MYPSKFEDFNLDDVDEELDLNDTVEDYFMKGNKKKKKHLEKDVSLRKTKREQDSH